MRGEVSTIRPIAPTPQGDAEWSAEMIGGPRPTLRGANRQSSIRNHQSQTVYEYDVYGQVAASDPNHPNRFMFTGREFDKETGLYYYRARYYNPTIGRFLQTDPIGYAGGLNLYTYCRNSPVLLIDPSGLVPIYNPSDGSWLRELDGPKLYPAIGSSHALPDVQNLGPYFVQGSDMGCVAAAIMNVCMTMGTMPIDYIEYTPTGVKYQDRPYLQCNGTDKQAVNWVALQLEQAPGPGDPDFRGFNLSQAALVLPNSTLQENATQTYGLGGIADEIDAGNSLIVGINLALAGSSGTPDWHAVAIVATPPTLREHLVEECGRDYPYMIANLGGDFGGQGTYFTEDGLVAYLASYGVYDDWLVASPPKKQSE